MKKPRPAVIADLLEKPGHLIRRAHQFSVAVFEDLAARDRITAPQHVVMTALFKHPGIDQVTLANLVALDKVTTGTIVSRLERRGLLRREQSMQDRRARILLLSEAGRQLLLRMQETVRQSQASLLANLSAAEGRELVRLLRKLIGAEPAQPRRKPARSRAARP
ncbi:MarR family winged helix-turn-helix transcriptional regulator [Vineibacter terrae]|uniref:MarR family winged helix-turn-helix transcriptional regulator n=1 Tax=Vineibacter terrae TaxID=2586908 RepID=UPI002E33E20F|nr:MarR family winged helix-turn-helix transcriptional regulator [Vineibacter terrae]HEX2888913.1 MarR family winged helix-turn-helix transcriptional regulator [Vineibacter terrae]